MARADPILQPLLDATSDTDLDVAFRRLRRRKDETIEYINGATTIENTSAIYILDASSAYTVFLPTEKKFAEVQFIGRTFTNGGSVQIGTTGQIISKKGQYVRVVEDEGTWYVLEDSESTSARVATTLDDNGTPTVADRTLFKTGGTTAITDFDDGVVGQTITILSGHAITITHGTPIKLSGSGNFVMASGDTLTLTMFNDQVWHEVGRMEA